MALPTQVSYPVVAIGDLHGQGDQLESLTGKIEAREGWRDAALVFLGDFVDRGPDVRGTIDLVLELLDRPAGGSAVMGNHDLALTRAARLDDGDPSLYWSRMYPAKYDWEATFRSYLGRDPGADVDAELAALKQAMPDLHRRFLAALPWIVEAERHLFLHCGLSPELEASPEAQVEALRARDWSRERLRPRPGTMTDDHWTPAYPVWIGADRNLSFAPLPYPGRVQVTGHKRATDPEASDVRIRLDTSGGYGRLTACLLRGPDAEPEFIRS